MENSSRPLSNEPSKVAALEMFAQPELTGFVSGATISAQPPAEWS